MGQTWRPPRMSGAKSGLRWRSRMAAAAIGGGVAERRQIRLHMQMHRHAVMRTNETMKAAPAMLKAQLDIEALRAEAL